VNDVVLFRAELDVEPDYLATEFYLDFDLYFSDLSNLGGPLVVKGYFQTCPNTNLPGQTASSGYFRICTSDFSRSLLQYFINPDPIGLNRL
jgi:hypothetical protein